MPDLDLKDMMLDVEAEFEKIVFALLAELELPMKKQGLRVRWMTMPDEQKEELKDQFPRMYDQLMRIVDEERSY